ncbi:GntT/GntP/DsdX family permease [Acetobacter orleanensis]|uniref:2-keto-3-deoxygluconate permease n=1 Tax=Acetobacter orleanensis TaxID=104099 RepID=A0A4Y3TQ76_9PROT|nr:gluconate:H+ symporter [Acetobacter orleanensis]KXV64262.1 permease DsdX [Acetobacter orleanensis]PCD79043.1 permease DsdX [Acetobacter orleanensis]GAN69441.1 gluconate permease [Acetobacter orleanensis JCM 7639]GBR22567.1 gluconate permease [Acetobacter orleanensis NRIC 0473]GEB82955.1 2-keto-3-deoxygluconate permease [Acetobacter orleanensis]
MTPLLASGLTAAAIVVLMLLIGIVRLNPFVTLFIVSIGLALVTGMPTEQAISSFENGMGHVLGHVAGVVALGTMLGKILAETGGADQIALTISRIAGKKRLPWAMMVIGLLVGLPVFFEVGFVLLIPLAIILSRRNDLPLPALAFPMAAALSVTHAMVPPHPATLLAITAYHANTAYTLFWGIVIGTPIAAIAGPIYAWYIAPRIGSLAPTALEDQFTTQAKHEKLPSFVLSCATLLMPVVLMLGGALAELIWPATALPYRIMHFLGNTDVALLVATLMSFWLMGSLSGLSRETILRFSNDCLAPTATIMLLIGAGGGFGRELIDSGLSHSITNLALGAHVPLLVLAWVLALLVRIATGSATVATTTASGIVGPILATSHSVSPELLVLVTGAGSVGLSLMNDAGFWQMKEYLGMNLSQTLRSWTMIETIIAVLGLLICLPLSWVIH